MCNVSYIDYSEGNFIDLLNFNDITADKDSSNLDNKSECESYASENKEVPSKKRR